MTDKHVAAFKAQHLMPGEEIKDYVEALRKGEAMQGRLIATTDRMVYYRKGILSEKLEVWPLSKISSVEHKAGIMFTKLKMYTSGDAIELDIYSNKEMAKVFVSKLQMAINRPTQSAPQPASASPSDNAPDDFSSMLQKLGDLRDKGILTEEEFTAKKSEILAKLT